MKEGNMNVLVLTLLAVAVQGLPPHDVSTAQLPKKQHIFQNDTRLKKAAHNPVFETEPFEVAQRITNGQPATRGQFPWLVHIPYNRMGILCAGTIISDRWILTVGRCINQTASLKVILGVNNRLKPEKGSFVMETDILILHKDFNPSYNDIALIKTLEPITFTDVIKPLKLPPKSIVSVNMGRKTFNIAGWGMIAQNGPYSDVIRYTDVAGIPTKKCQVYKTKMIASQMCTLGKDTSSACGDNGAPLVYKHRDGNQYVVGISSSGGYSCYKNPQIYSRVSSYLNWIGSVTGIPILK